MNKLESTIPFCGFYCSFIDADIEHQIGQQIEWDSDIYDLNEDEQQILWDSYLSVNRSYFYNQIAEDYTNFYIDENSTSKLVETFEYNSDKLKLTNLNYEKRKLILYLFYS